MTRQQAKQLPRALVVTRNLPPLIGGMERLNLHLVHELARDYSVTVIGPSGCRAFLPGCVQVVEIPVRPLGAFLWRALLASLRQSPGARIVIAGSGLTAPIVKLAAVHARGKSLAYVHGLDLVSNNFVYRCVWVPFLRRLDHALANSSATADIARRMGVAKRSVTVLNPGVTMPVDCGEAAASFRASHALQGKRILLSVGRLTSRKGLAQFITRGYQRILEKYPNAVLVAIGDEAKDAVGAGATNVRKGILQAAQEAGVGESVHILPHCSDEELTAAYFGSDVHIFPVVPVKGDIEGFGMVALEAAAHGLPTVAFAVGGVPDAVSDGLSGGLVAPGDYVAFSDAVIRFLDEGRSGSQLGARQFAHGFEWSKFGEKLRKEIDNVVSGNQFRGNSPEGHAVLDMGSRQKKARKIEAILDLSSEERRLSVLEIGTGSGGIAHYFAKHHLLDCRVDAVDVKDSRQVFEGVNFQLVAGVQLPFANETFDVVISNHVIEHVGGREDQVRHLEEIRRVLAPTGRGYLAVPNRWMLIEPHYRVAFLSWLPRSLRSKYLNLRRGVPIYDCEPLESREIERMFMQVGLLFERNTGRAIKESIRIEGKTLPPLDGILSRTPDEWLNKLAPVTPTLVYRVWPKRRTCGP